MTLVRKCISSSLLVRGMKSTFFILPRFRLHGREARERGPIWASRAEDQAETNINGRQTCRLVRSIVRGLGGIVDLPSRPYHPTRPLPPAAATGWRALDVADRPLAAPRRRRQAPQTRAPRTRVAPLRPRPRTSGRAPPQPCACHTGQAA
jgi:hypothetical protein